MLSESEIPLVLIEVADAGGEQLDACGEVGEVAHLNGLVDVAGGDRDGSGNGTIGHHALEAGAREGGNAVAEGAF